MKNKLIAGMVVSLVLTMFLTSCLYGIKGNGKVVKNERQTGKFEAISASAGIDVILLQDSVIKVVVEADENLQEIIKTEVSNGKLKIYPIKRISSCVSKKVYVTFRSIHELQASSGAEVTSKMELKMTALQISVSSGASIHFALTGDKVNVQVSSGGDLDLTGLTESLDVDGSSGANINMAELKSKSCNAGASSGANLKVYASEKINAHASSGGNIRVIGNPKDRNVEKSSGGDVSFR
jgi:hypothetical protein